MKKLFKRLFGGVKGVIIIAFSFLLFPFARLLLWHKNIWLVSEHGYEARDNGYCFFEYMRKKHKDINCYYAITKDTQDYEKVALLGNVIEFGSLKHLAYFCAAKYIISSKTQGFCPSYYLTLFRKHFHLWGKYVFLQHGITKDNQIFLYKKRAKIDLFICGAKPEYDDIIKHYGYKKDEVAYTGFARFDNYYHLKTKKQILVMPTWRRYADISDFCKTTYFKTWMEFINSSKLNNLLLNSGYYLLFYLHPQYKDFFHFFKTNQSNIKILNFENNDIQTLIKESDVYITDFSSLAFDFGYMGRPVIYYQYDEDAYFAGHYIKGYFDYRRDGFGPVCNNFDEVLANIDAIIKHKTVFSNFYKKNQTRFFPLCDNNNCERIYGEIKRMK